MHIATVVPKYNTLCLKWKIRNQLVLPQRCSPSCKRGSLFYSHSDKTEMTVLVH